MRRREVLGGIAALPLLGQASFAQSMDNHFFIHLYVPGGWDGQYLLDARPLEMTQKGLIQNYTGKEPFKWTGSNGFSTLASEVARPLHAYKDKFTILNGVNMLTHLDGHQENKNYSLVGDGFDGQFFLPHLSKNTPIDFLQFGNTDIAAENIWGGIQLTPKIYSSLLKSIQSSKSLGVSSDSIEFIKKQIQRRFKGQSFYEAGAQRIEQALAGQKTVVDPLKRAKILTQTDDNFQNQLETLFRLFKAGAANTALMSMPVMGQLDAHNQSDAARQPINYADMVAKIKMFLDWLDNSSFDGIESLRNQTTFVITSEFTRTMRQKDKAMDKTGTDHNSLNNTVLIGGKGIKSGMVLGQSDQQSAGEILSPVHLAKDQNKVRVMGRPYDPQTQRPIIALPTEYKEEEYIGYANVLNTLYQLGGIPTSQHYKFPLSKKTARVLTEILNPLKVPGTFS